MIRRNGKPTSCEPCRVAKVRCDHAAPVCQRCQSKGISNRCYYHPAPLTRGKSKSTGGLLKRNNHSQHNKKDVRDSHNHTRAISSSSSSPSNMVKTPTSESSQFLGSTSYLSVFREIPSWVSSTSIQSLQGEFELWRTNHTYVCARLVRLVSAAAFYRDNTAWYYSWSRFIVVPAPLVLNSLMQLQEYIESNSWDGDGNWETLYKQITVASNNPLRLSTTTSAEEFSALISGRNLRWEFMGFMFALAGVSVQHRYPNKEVLNLGNGEQIDAETFTKEMVLACNACIELCKQYEHVNDVVLWMRYMHVYLGSEVLGENSERVYSLFGDLVSSIYAMGLHYPQQDNRDIPFYLSETRKRILAVAHRMDKNIATFLGRPPRLPHQYCAAALPSDLADEDLFLAQISIETVLTGLDQDGWNCAGRFHPATVIRMRQILSVLSEKVLQLSLGFTGGNDLGHRLLSAYQECQQTWDKIPDRFHYNCGCWEKMDASECLALLIVNFEYLFSVFQLHRIRSQESVEGMKDMLDTCVQVLSIMMDLTKQSQRDEIRKQLPWIFLIYLIPAAGALVTEIHCRTLSNQALPSSTPRSEIIRTLSFLISWLRNFEMPPTMTSAACMELINIISRILDSALDYRPLLTVSSELEHTGVNAIRITNATSFTSSPVAESGEESEKGAVLGQHQRVGLDLPSEALGTEWGTRLEGDLGFELASEGFLTWLDDLDLDVMAPGRYY